MARGKIAGRYELIEPLGIGAMGSVWLGEDAELGRQVAVKLLGRNPDRARFEREAHAAAALGHPHICRLYDYGQADDEPYIVLEYLPGGSLEERLARAEPLPDEEAMRIARGLSGALAHAHERGVVHRDLKPSNVLFDAEGRAKIADFGIARLGGADTLTEAGTILGTAAYISPEQAAGEPATAASDVYSWGVILFRMLTGKLPFEAPSAVELARKHRDEPAPPLEGFRPDAPPILGAAVLAALAKDPRTRPADGAALLHLLGDEPGARPPLEEHPTQVLTRPGIRRRRPPLVLGALGVLGLLAAGIGAAFLAVRENVGDAPQPSSTPLSSSSLPAASTEASTSAPPISATAASTTEPTTSTQQTATPPPLPTTAPTGTTPPTTDPTEPEPPPTIEPTTSETTTAATTTADTVATTPTTGPP
ncbi:MAG: serine/threonine protein kinase [Actinobacteria bacterium]|nr:serine/threonine protein kinase [Actinomycetota bacterium]